MSDRTILWVFDSLRSDRLSHLGYSRETTPALDGLADDGVSFTNAFSQAYWTGPSSGSIMTSEYALNHRTGFLYHAEDRPESVIERFNDGGYTTGCVTTTAAVDDSNYPEFDSCIGLHRETDLGDERLAEAVSDSVIEWVNEHEDDPFFLVVWSDGTHHPYRVPSDYDRSFTTDVFDPTVPNLKEETNGSLVKDAYDENVRYNDAEFGRVLSFLRDRDLYDGTTLAVTADHGELFGEHTRLEAAHPLVRKLVGTLTPAGTKTRAALDRESRWLGHQSVVPYDELLRVPLILKPSTESSVTPKMGTCSQLAQTIDVAPTLADMAPEVTSTVSFQGSSLFPAINNDVPVHDDVRSSTPVLFGPTIFHTIRNREYKYVRMERKPLSQIRREVAAKPAMYVQNSLQYASLPREILFDVDGSERENVIEDYPEIAEAFREKFANWDHNSGASVVDLDEDTRSHLADLGYLE